MTMQSYRHVQSGAQINAVCSYEWVVKTVICTVGGGNETSNEHVVDQAA